MDMQAVRQAIGRRMETVARAHGMGLAATARHVEEAESTVRQWWQGNRLPPAEKMDRYAECFGFKAGFFYGEGLAGDICEAELGISRRLWARLQPADRQAIRSQVLVWAHLRTPPAAECTERTENE